MVGRVELSEEELALCRKAFGSFDKDGSGTIDASELKAALNSMGQNPSDEELFVLIHDVDEDNSGQIEFAEDNSTSCTAVVNSSKPDKSGKVSTEKLRATIQEFELLLDVDRLIKEVDLDRSGYLDYQEFASILASK